MKNALHILFLLICFSCFGGNPKDIIFKSHVLKGGYTLEYKRHDSINYACLVKDGKEAEVSEHESDTNMPLDLLGKLYADFDSTFVMTTHIGADPIKIEIINKINGATVMYGASPFYLDTVKNLMMFEGSYRRRGKLILYNFNTNKTEVYVAPQDTHCFCCFCWKLISLTPTEIQIEYLNMNHEKVIKTYQRQ